MAPGSLPRRIGPVDVPQDALSRATWDRAARSLPKYLFDHSVRCYAWAALIAEHDELAFEPRILWPAALLHDVGLTRIGRSAECFEYEGATIARRFVLGQGMAATEADVVARAIVLHMAPRITEADGPAAILLDRATGLDVRGVGAGIVADRREAIDEAFPRGAFDRLFLAALRGEVAIRGDCQSAGLLQRLDAAPA